MINFFPKYFSGKAISLYFGVLVICNILFFSHFMPLIWWTFGLIEVIGFFYFSNRLTRKWRFISSKSFAQKLFTFALLLRIIWVIFSYFFYIEMNGEPFE